MKLIKPSLSVPLLTSVLFFVVVSLNIQLSPMKGIADNGDFGRIMSWFDIRHESQTEDQKHLGWVERYYSYGNNDASSREFSSGLIFIGISTVFNKILNGNIFDIKILGLIHTLFVSVLIFFTLHFLQKIYRLILIVVIPFIFLALIDSAYVSYFNSFYEESAGIIFLLLYVVLILKSLTEASTKKNIFNVVAVSISAALLISAKPQYFIFAVPTILTNVLLFRRKISNGMLLGISFMIATFAISYYLLGTPNIIKKWNVYNTVFAQVLGSTANIDRAGKIFDIDSSFHKYRGIPAYFEGGINDPYLQKYLKVETYGKVIKYYIVTPKELLNLTKKLSESSLSTIISFLGYYDKASNFGPAEGPRNGTYWSYSKMGIGKVFGVLMIPLLIFVLVVLALMIKKNRYGILGMFLSLSAICQIGIVLISEGLYGVPEKHLLMFNILFDFLLLFLVTYLLIIFTNLLLETVEKVSNVQLSINFGKRTLVNINDRSSKKLYENTVWEPDVLAYIDHYAKGDVLEIGSHIGVHSIYLANKIGSKNTVYAFEPSPSSFQLLKKNCQMYKNIVPINVAVSDGSTNNVSLRHYFGFSAWDGITKMGRFVKDDRPFIRRIFSKTVVVESISLDEFLSKNKGITPTFLKIDAENSEMSIIKGSKRMLNYYKPTIVFEGGDLGREEGEKTKDIIKILAEMGYKIFNYSYETQLITQHKTKKIYTETINLLALPRK